MIFWTDDMCDIGEFRSSFRNNIAMFWKPGISVCAVTKDAWGMKEDGEKIVEQKKNSYEKSAHSEDTNDINTGRLLRMLQAEENRGRNIVLFPYSGALRIHE